MQPLHKQEKLEVTRREHIILASFPSFLMFYPHAMFVIPTPLYLSLPLLFSPIPAMSLFSNITGKTILPPSLSLPWSYTQGYLGGDCKCHQLTLLQTHAVINSICCQQLLELLHWKWSKRLIWNTSKCLWRGCRGCCSCCCGCTCICCGIHVWFMLLDCMVLLMVLCDEGTNHNTTLVPVRTSIPRNWWLGSELGPCRNLANSWGQLSIQHHAACQNM